MSCNEIHIYKNIKKTLGSYLIMIPSLPFNSFSKQNFFLRNVRELVK